MTLMTPALALQAANDNPGGATSASVALYGLVDLLARAELQTIARQGAANSQETPKFQEDLS